MIVRGCGGACFNGRSLTSIRKCLFTPGQIQCGFLPPFPPFSYAQLYPLYARVNSPLPTPSHIKKYIHISPVFNLCDICHCPSGAHTVFIQNYGTPFLLPPLPNPPFACKFQKYFAGGISKANDKLFKKRTITYYVRGVGKGDGGWAVK